MRQPGRLVLLGHPVGHSMSPRIHDAALRAAGIPLRYEALDVEPSRFDATIDLLRRERAAGNVTVPHKERMYNACDALTPLARRVGAVNVFWIDDDDRLVGDNTDVGGFDAAVTQFLGLTPHEWSVGLLGAGGSAAAVLAAIERWPGCVAHVYNRTPERARILCERFGAVAHAVDDVGVIAGAQLVINATSIGLKDDGVPVDPFLVPRESAVFDLVYRPGGTNFVRAMQARGNQATDGIGMLVEQAALAFEQWFGIAPSRELMHEALMSR
jgi:shikimate dehydrogenase